MSQKDEVDIALLRILDTLFKERSVTKAGIKLNQSQPTISASLRRLRDITGDALFVRGMGGMVPTEYGLKLKEPTENALRYIELIGCKRDDFNPSSYDRVFHVGCPDYLNIWFVPTVVHLFRRSAPLARLEFHALGPAYDYEDALEQGGLDLVVGNWPAPPEQLHLSPLLSDEIVGLVSKKHPFASRPCISTEQYLAASHVVPSPYSLNQRGAIDAHLGRERGRRNIIVTLPFFGLAPYVLLESDLIFTTTRRFAEHYINHLPLSIVQIDMEFPTMQYYQLWHERSHYSSEIRWLRSILSDAARVLAGERPLVHAGKFFS